MRIPFAILALSVVFSIQPAIHAAPQPVEKFKVLSAKFGLIDYNQPGLQSGEFAIHPITVIPRNEKYFGWVIEIKCPADVEGVDWTEITYMPSPHGKAGADKDDPSITTAKDRRSFTTRRGVWCHNGIARIDDIYGREDDEPLGNWRIEIWIGRQKLAEFPFAITELYRK